MINSLFDGVKRRGSDRFKPSPIANVHLSGDAVYFCSQEMALAFRGNTGIKYAAGACVSHSLTARAAASAG